MQNLLTNLPRSLPQELAQVVARGRSVRIERIVSTGHISPPGFWYDQNDAEWVLILQGEAELLMEGDNVPTRLVPGDHVLIPPHRRHRVERTSTDGPTVWLAVFFDE